MSRRSPRNRNYTKEVLEKVVKDSFSVSEVLSKLNMPAGGGNQQTINSKIRLFDIDITHFTGQGWAKGKTKETSVIVASTSQKISLTDEEMFSENTEFRNSTYRKRLLKLGWKYECKICGLDNWLDKIITLHIDHINGNRNDNRLENLRFLCPNCHQQTDTWGKKHS